MPDLLTTFGLGAVVLIVSGLASGVIVRSPISYPMFFLGLGVLLGPKVLGLISVGSGDEVLEAIATLTLALVLFIDGLRITFDGSGRAWLAPVLALGPGALATIALVTIFALLIFDLSIVQSLMVGAILASTDPVVLRGVVDDERIPRSIRRVLTVEAGTNDMVTLPTVLVLIELARASGHSVGGWAVFLAELLLLAPLVGIAVGWVGAGVMARVDGLMGISRTYQALYGLGLVLASYAIGDLVGGSGFVAAFAAGITISVSNFDLCDCFIEYGEVTSEFATLLTFIFFGTLLSTLLGSIAFLPVLLFAALALLVARPVAMSIVLRRAVLSKQARLFIGWFGPRGLSSLLLALLVVHGDAPGAVRILTIVGGVVVVSVVVHGMSAPPLTSWYAHAIERKTAEEEREGTAAGLFRGLPEEVPSVEPEELAGLLDSDHPPIVLDVRTRSAMASDPSRIPGSVRVPPDLVVDWAARISRDRMVITYCT